MDIQSRDQLRAKHALNSLESRDSRLSDKDLKAAVKGLPAMIHMNGLGQAFAFHLTEPKKFPERLWLINTVFDWLKENSGVYADIQQNNLTALKAVTLSDLTTHQIAQQEAQAYLLWLKKFANAILSSEDEKKLVDNVDTDVTKHQDSQ